MTHAYVETDGQPYRVDPGAVNLGLAVDVERADGSRFLVVPVIRDAASLDFAAFHARYEELVEKARTNKLSPDDMSRRDDHTHQSRAPWERRPRCHA